MVKIILTVLLEYFGISIGTYISRIFPREFTDLAVSLMQMSGAPLTDFEHQMLQNLLVHALWIIRSFIILSILVAKLPLNPTVLRLLVRSIVVIKIAIQLTSKVLQL